MASAAGGVTEAIDVAGPLGAGLPEALATVVVALDGGAVAGVSPATVGAGGLTIGADAGGFVVAGGADTAAAGGATAGGFVEGAGGTVALATLVASPAGELAAGARDADGMAPEGDSTTCV